MNIRDPPAPYGVSRHTPAVEKRTCARLAVAETVGLDFARFYGSVRFRSGYEYRPLGTGFFQQDIHRRHIRSVSGMGASRVFPTDETPMAAHT